METEVAGGVSALGFILDVDDVESIEALSNSISFCKFSCLRVSQALLMVISCSCRFLYSERKVSSSWVRCSNPWSLKSSIFSYAFGLPKSVAIRDHLASFK